MGQQTYKWNNKTYYEVYVQGRHPKTEKRMQKKARYTSSGERINSKVVANRVEYQLKKELEEFTKGVCLWTWKKWHDECLHRMALTYRKSTVMSYDGDLKKWLPKDWLSQEMTDFQKMDVHHLLFDELGEDLSPHGKKNLLRRVQRIFEMALEEGIIGKNPTKGIKIKVPPVEQKVLSSEEAGKLLNEAKLANHRCYPLWAFALFTGMRNGEIYAIRHTDIDLTTGLIHVTKQFTAKDGIHSTKGNSNRVVPISNELRPLLIQLIKQGGFKEKLWMWNNDKKAEKTPVVCDDLLLPRHRSWRSCEQSKVLREFCRTIGITEIKFHDLRATFITNMLAQGEAISTVMKIVGHSRMATTDVYNRLAGVGIKGSTNKLGYRLPNEAPLTGKVIPMFKGSR